MSRQFQAFGNFDPIANALIRRGDQISAPPDVELTHHGHVRPPENAQDLPLGASLQSDPGNLRKNAISAHPFGGFLGIYVDIALDFSALSLREHESEAIAVHEKLAYRVFRIAFQRRKMSGAQLQQEALAREPVKRFFQSGAGLRVEPQLSDKLFVSCSCVWKLADVLKDAGIVEQFRHTRNYRQQTLCYASSTPD